MSKSSFFRNHKSSASSASRAGSQSAQSPHSPISPPRERERATPSSLPRLQPSIASTMRGYNAPRAPPSGPPTTINENSNTNSGYHSAAGGSPIRTGGLGGGGTGGRAGGSASTSANTRNGTGNGNGISNSHSNSHSHSRMKSTSNMRGTPPPASSWSGSNAFHSPSQHGTGLPATAGGASGHSGHSGHPGSTSTWSRAHRPQQASSADLDHMVASTGLNRFAMSPHSEHNNYDYGRDDYDHEQHHSSGINSANTATPGRDIYVRMHSPTFDNDGDGAEFDSVGDFARAFSPPRYAGYASLPDDDGPLSAVSATHDDRFTPLPTMRSRPRREASHGHEPELPRIDARALASPPPHQRAQHAPTEESHESGLSGSSAMTGITDASAFRPQLSSSTSTIITQATAITSPIMGSDEMLMALMASQAAVDCDALPTGGWEEVESWKKELSLLSTRLDALQARHQREVRILTAARTLQKLNTSNKRISRQTMESLEQSEKRVDKAEKEVLVLRDRESALRRRLMEHWAGIMAWEVRRLERSHNEAQSRLEMHVRAAESDRESLIERLAAIDTGDHIPSKMHDTRDFAAASRDGELQARITELETKLQAERVEKAELESERELAGSRMKSLEADRERRAGRIAELEEVVLELGRRERSLEDGAKDHDEKLFLLERERDGWHDERAQYAEERKKWEAERKEWEAERKQWETERAELQQHAQDKDSWTAERSILVSERDALHAEHSTLQTQTREHGALKLAWEAERGRLTTERDALQHEHAELKARHVELQAQHEESREAWLDEREQMVAERELLEAATSEQTGSREQWTRERETHLAKQERMAADLEALAVEHDRLKEESRDMHIRQAQAVALEAEKGELEGEYAKLREEHRQLLEATDRDASASRMTSQRLGAMLGSILGRNPVAETDLVRSLDEVRVLLDQRTAELETLHSRHAEELQTLTVDRDAWKAKASEAKPAASSAAEMTVLVRKIRTQNETIADLNAQLAAAGGSRGVGNPGLEAKLQRLWATLPSPSARAEAGLSSPSVVSPNAHVNFAALQHAYAGSKDQYDPDEVFERIAGLVADGKLMVERMQRMEVDNKRHKANATRAAQLVTDSRASLEKYHQQVEELEAQLARGGGGSAGASELEREIDILQRELEVAHGENERLRADADEQKETIDMFSARTLMMADEHERDKNILSARLQKEMDALRVQLSAAEAGADEERNRAHLQSAQMMGEMMDLQDEIAKLRGRR